VKQKDLDKFLAGPVELAVLQGQRRQAQVRQQNQPRQGELELFWWDPGSRVVSTN